MFKFESLYVFYLVSGASILLSPSLKSILNGDIEMARNFKTIIVLKCFSSESVLFFFSQILTSVQTTPMIVMSMLIVTIPWGPLIARVTLDTQETEQHVLVNMITLFSIEVLLFIFHTLLKVIDLLVPFLSK